jgi:hypothetical protein
MAIAKEIENRQDELDDSVTQLTQVVGDMAAQQSAQDGKLDNILNMLAERKAPDVHSVRQSVDANGLDVNASGMVADVDGEIEVSKASMDDAWTRQHTADLAFNEDMLMIAIHEASEKNADQIFEVMVNGRSQLFQRGREYSVARKFVETLARAKPVTYRNEEYVAMDGTRSVRWPTHRGLRYSFSVLHDPHPRGADWLKSILSQP